MIQYYFKCQYNIFLKALYFMGTRFLPVFTVNEHGKVGFSDFFFTISVS